MSIDELVAWMNEFEHKNVQAGRDIMREEVPQGRTRGLQNSIVIEAHGGGVYWIGTHKEYAPYVQNGRGDVYPRDKKWLHWVDPAHGSVFTKHAGPAPAQDFITPTVNRLIAYINAYK